MSGFPGPHSYSEFTAAQQNLARNSEAFRDTCAGQRHLTGSSFASDPVIPRTPDDDICDAAFFRSRVTEDPKAAAMLDRLARYCRTLEETVANLKRTPDADDFCESLLYRAQDIEAGDRRTAEHLRRASETIRRLKHEVCELRNQNRKEGNREGN